jgi:phage shock protein C
MSTRTKFYVDKRNGKFLGVCAGVADYFGTETLWIRVGFIAALFVAQLWFLLPMYFLVSWFADRKPDALYMDTPAEQKFYTKLRVSPQRSIRDTRSMYRDVDRRLQDIEAYVTSSNSRLSNEIDALR